MSARAARGWAVVALAASVVCACGPRSVDDDAEAWGQRIPDTLRLRAAFDLVAGPATALIGEAPTRRATFELRSAIEDTGALAPPQGRWASSAPPGGLATLEGTLTSDVARAVARRTRPDVRYLRRLDVQVEGADGDGLRVRAEASFATFTAASTVAFEARFVLARPSWRERLLGSWARGVTDVAVRHERERVTIDARMVRGDLERLLSAAIEAWASVPSVTSRRSSLHGTQE